jgi:dihydroceramidase
MALEPGIWVRLPHNEHETRIFESSLEKYLQNNDREGYSGPISATIDWCERNGAVTFLIAEFWNSLSNGFLFIVALWGLLMVASRGYETRHALLFGGYGIIAAGSFLYHASLTFHFQILDELPMMICIETLIWNCISINPAVERRYKKFFEWLADVFFLIFVVFCFLHWYFQFVKLFQTAFGVFMVVSATVMLREAWKQKTEVVGQKLASAYLGFMLLGVAVWLIDQIFCEHWQQTPHYDVLPFCQFHAHWHFFTACACFAAGLFCVFRRAWYFGEEPRLEWAFGFMPYVVRGKINHHK